MDRSIIEAPFSSAMGHSMGHYGQQIGSQLQSPYLQFDASLLQPSQQSEFIFPDGAQRHSRGRFELAFSQIGSSVMTGAGIGGAIGTVRGFQSITGLKDSFSVQRSQLLNYVTKNGASMANTFGTIALIYSALGVGLSFIQDSNDDINTIASAVTTGALYGGLSQLPTNQTTEKAISIGRKLWHIRAKRSAIGAVIGASAAITYVFLLNKDKYLNR